MEYTHLLKIQRSQDMEWLFRLSDGCEIGVRQYSVVLQGEEPNRRTSRLFMDEKHAAAYLRGEVAQTDMRGRGIDGPPIIQEVEMEGQIVLPPGATELPKFGTHAFGPRKQ